jgi:phosphatidylinositol-3-phosphatase
VAREHAPRAGLTTRLRIVFAIAAVLLVVATAAGGSSDPVPQPQRVAVLVLENRSYEQVIGNPSAPFINRLARRYALATDYYALAHRSLPNYVGLTGGNLYGIQNDCTGCATWQPNLLNELDTAGIGWRAYFERLSSARPLTEPAPTYNPNYNPFGYYKQVAGSRSDRRRMGNFVELRRAIARRGLERFTWIAPDVLHDGHDASLRRADSFVAGLVPGLLRALGPRGVLYVLWDEGPNSDLRGADGQPGGGRVALIAAGGAARRHTRLPTTANHYALLRTLSAGFGVPPLGNAGLPSTPVLSGLLR